jgi:ankyrin repeat protein
VPPLVKTWGQGFMIGNIVLICAIFYAPTQATRVTGVMMAGFVLMLALALVNIRAGRGLVEGEAESVWLTLAIGCLLLTPGLFLFRLNPLFLFLQVGLIAFIFAPPLKEAFQHFDQFEYRWGREQAAAPAATFSGPGCVEYLLIIGLIAIVSIIGMGNLPLKNVNQLFGPIPYAPIRPPPELHTAITANDQAKVTRLLQQGADLNSRDREGNSPLHLAVRVKNLVFITLLLKAGSDVSSSNHLGKAPLHQAVETGSTAIVEYLLSRGADLQAKDQGGSTPFHGVTTQAMTVFLLGRGAGLQQGDKTAATPLHHAVYYQRLDAVKALLEAGAGTERLDVHGESPLHKAVYGNPALDQAIAQLLIRYGANPNLKSNAGETPYLLAKKRGNRPMMEFFRGYGTGQ